MLELAVKLIAIVAVRALEIAGLEVVAVLAEKDAIGSEMLIGKPVVEAPGKVELMTAEDLSIDVPRMAERIAVLELVLEIGKSGVSVLILVLAPRLTTSITEPDGFTTPEDELKESSEPIVLVTVGVLKAVEITVSVMGIVLK